MWARNKVKCGKDTKFKCGQDKKVKCGQAINSATADLRSLVQA